MTDRSSEEALLDLGLDPAAVRRVAAQADPATLADVLALARQARRLAGLQVLRTVAEWMAGYEADWDARNRAGPAAGGGRGSGKASAD